MPNDEPRYEKYICEYRYKGKRWDVDIFATSFEDAENRLKALSCGNVVGVSKFEIPYRLGWAAKAMVFFGNLFRI